MVHVRQSEMCGMRVKEGNTGVPGTACQAPGQRLSRTGRWSARQTTASQGWEGNWCHQSTQAAKPVSFCYVPWDWQHRRVRRSACTFRSGRAQAASKGSPTWVESCGISSSPCGGRWLLGDTWAGNLAHLVQCKTPPPPAGTPAPNWAV